MDKTELRSQLEHIKILADGALHEVEKEENDFLDSILLQSALDIESCARNVRMLAHG